MGQDAQAAIGFGVKVKGDFVDVHPSDARRKLADRFGLESDSPYEERTGEAAAVYREFKAAWEAIGITTISGGSYDCPDVALVAEETVSSTWWDSLGEIEAETLETPDTDLFRTRLESFLDLLDGEIETYDKPQWLLSAFFG